VDPITLAIASAVTAGVTKIGESAIADAYHGLKDLLKQKFGDASSVVKAADEIEANPESKSRPATLNEEVVAAKADQDQEILKAAEVLLAKVKETPGGETIITQHISGGERHNIAGRDLLISSSRD
jgi:glycogen synthase